MRKSNIILIALTIMLFGCANPPYKFQKDEPYALLKTVEGYDWNICTGGKNYKLSKKPKQTAYYIPANKKIVLINYASFSGYQVTYSCAPMKGFTPEAGKTYHSDLMINPGACNIGLAEEDITAQNKLKPVELSAPVCTQ